MDLRHQGQGAGPASETPKVGHFALRSAAARPRMRAAAVLLCALWPLTAQAAAGPPPPTLESVLDSLAAFRYRVESLPLAAFAPDEHGQQASKDALLARIDAVRYRLEDTFHTSWADQRHVLSHARLLWTDVVAGLDGFSGAAPLDDLLTDRIVQEELFAVARVLDADLVTVGEVS